MKIIIPAAGYGKRFADAGYNMLKPLIEVDKKPIIEHVTNMFPGESDFIFVCNENHLKTTNIKDIITRLSGKIVAVKPHSVGPVHTVLQASHLIDDDEPVIICYCDFYEWWNYNHFKDTVLKNNCDAAVTAYTGFHPHLLGNNFYAGMRVKDNWMLECKEKHSFTNNKMDCFHQTGKFYFSSGRILKEFFTGTIENGISVNGEYYISLVTQMMVEAGLKVYVYPVEHFLQWGTPKDMEEYNAWSSFFTGNGEKPSDNIQTFSYWNSFFRKCQWHPYGKGENS